MSGETKAKIAARIRGIKRSPETRAKIAEALRKRVVSDETRAKMAAAHAGRTQSQESREKTRQGLLGRPLSEEHKNKLRQAKLRNPVRYWEGKTRPSPSAETREKMRVANGGKPKPDYWSPHIKRPHPYNGITFRSSYEVRVAKALDALGIRWVYEPKRFDLGPFRYCPDFYLPDGNCYWEVKGWFSPTAQSKVSAFRAQHPETPLIVVMKDAIESLEASINLRAQACT